MSEFDNIGELSQHVSGQMDGTERFEAISAKRAQIGGRPNVQIPISQIADWCTEWAPNFSAAGDIYIPARAAMTIDQGNAPIGVGTIAYQKSTAAAPGAFGVAALPVTLEKGAWLKISASAITGFVALHLKRIA